MPVMSIHVSSLFSAPSNPDSSAVEQFFSSAGERQRQELNRDLTHNRSNKSMPGYKTQLTYWHVDPKPASTCLFVCPNSSLYSYSFWRHPRCLVFLMSFFPMKWTGFWIRSRPAPSHFITKPSHLMTAQDNFHKTTHTRNQLRPDKTFIFSSFFLPIAFSPIGHKAFLSPQWNEQSFRTKAFQLRYT